MGEKIWNGEGVPTVGEFCEFKGEGGWRKVQIAYVGPELISATYPNPKLGIQEMAIFYKKAEAVRLMRPIEELVSLPATSEAFSLQHWKDLAIERFEANNKLDTENIALRFGLREMEEQISSLHRQIVQFMKENNVGRSDR